MFSQLVEKAVTVEKNQALAIEVDMESDVGL